MADLKISTDTLWKLIPLLLMFSGGATGYALLQNDMTLVKKLVNVESVSETKVFRAIVLSFIEEQKEHNDALGSQWRDRTDDLETDLDNHVTNEHRRQH